MKEDEKNKLFKIFDTNEEIKTDVINAYNLYFN
jgi:hypothetical protein